MRTQLVNPNIANFVKSLRDVGYTFEIAVADILDNSISANATEVKIHTVPKPEIIFALLDNGDGMSKDELTEAMRLATKNPEEPRDKKDLGRFGLGLKTASFSQCRKLTVFSKKDGRISIKQWDLDYISSSNSWLLITPNISEFRGVPLLAEFSRLTHGTLVLWQDDETLLIDKEAEKYNKKEEKEEKKLVKDLEMQTFVMRQDMSIWKRLLDYHQKDELDSTISPMQLDILDKYILGYFKTPSAKQSKILYELYYEALGEGVVL
ncbi:MAG TPA: ATP-binding protein [Campylobacterales bacterium]|nr:ATP-binding protein [Campylobacterales bacterium]HIP41210.1 ATP-binding protein [Campylobacterales bacterium]